MCREILSWAKKVYLGNSLAGVRKDIPRKKSLTFVHFPKGGRGVQPEFKSFGAVFLGLSFGHFPKRGGGVEPILKVSG